MSSSVAAITIREGEPRTGKTYGFVCDLMNDVLPYWTGAIVHNLPLNQELIAKAYAKDENHRREILDRLVMMTPEVRSSWKTDIEHGGSGPWNDLSGMDLSGALIVIDECHSMMGDGFSTAHNTMWNTWLKDIGHRCAKLQLITQNRYDLPDNVVRLASTVLTTMRKDLMRDPTFGVLFGDWYELWAGFVSGKFASSCYIQEWRRYNRSLKMQDSREYRYDPNIYAMYNSYSATEQGEEGSEHQPQMFELLNKRQLLAWFIKRNLFTILPRMGPWLLIAACFIGGPAAIYWFNTRPPRSAKEKPAFGSSRRDPPAAAAVSMMPPSPVDLNPPEWPARTPANPKPAKSPVMETVVSQVSKVAEVITPGEYQQPKPKEPEHASIVGLTPRLVHLSDGSTVAPGERLPDGRQVDSIDLDRRGVVCGGQLVRLPPRKAPANTGGVLSGFSLPGTTAAGSSPVRK